MASVILTVPTQAQNLGGASRVGGVLSLGGGNGSAGGAAITRVEAVSKTGSCSAGLTVNFATSTTAGELIIVLYEMASAGNTAGTVADSASQVYTKDWEKLSIENHAGYGFQHFANSASGVSSVKITGGSSDGVCLIIASHYKGLAASPLDQNSGTPTPSGHQSTPYTYASGTVTTTSANELLCGGAGAYAVAGGVAVSFVATGSWALVSSKNDNNGDGIAYQEQIVSSTQSNIADTGTVSGATTTNVVSGIVTFHQ